MMKEHERREHLKTLDEEDRKKEEEHYEELKKKHADHPKVNHPVSLHAFNFSLCLISLKIYSYFSNVLFYRVARIS